MHIELSKAKVELVDAITWGQKEQIQQALLSGMTLGMTGTAGLNAEALSKAKYKAIEVCIKRIEEDGAEKPFSREWLDNLSVQDGDALYEAVEAITNPAKKA